MDNNWRHQQQFRKLPERRQRQEEKKGSCKQQLQQVSKETATVTAAAQAAATGKNISSRNYNNKKNSSRSKKMNFGRYFFAQTFYPAGIVDTPILALVENINSPSSPLWRRPTSSPCRWRRRRLPWMVATETCCCWLLLSTTLRQKSNAGKLLDQSYLSTSPLEIFPLWLLTSN